MARGLSESTSRAYAGGHAGLWGAWLPVAGKWFRESSCQRLDQLASLFNFQLPGSMSMTQYAAKKNGHHEIIFALLFFALLEPRKSTFETLKSTSIRNGPAVHISRSWTWNLPPLLAICLKSWAQRVCCEGKVATQDANFQTASMYRTNGRCPQVGPRLCALPGVLCEYHGVLQQNKKLEVPLCQSIGVHEPPTHFYLNVNIPLLEWNTGHIPPRSCWRINTFFHRLHKSEHATKQFVGGHTRLIL